MPRFSVVIDLGNDAMSNRVNVDYAISRSLKGAVEPYKVFEPGDHGSIMDVNGNTVGHWSVTNEEG